VGDIGDTTWGGRVPEKKLYKRYGGDARVLLEAGPGVCRGPAYDRAVTDAACARLREHDAEKPLFLTVGLHGPHSPFCCDRDRFAHYYDALPRLPVGPRPEDVHPAVRDHLELHEMLDPDPEAFHRARAAYYGMVETVDEHVGRIRESAGRLGKDVLFVYASDHGDLAGAHGMFWKCMMYDGSAKVPMLAAGCGLPAGRRIEEPTGLVDLGVTLLSACGAEAMLETDGEDLWPVLRGEAEADPARAVVSQYANSYSAQPPVGMIRRGRHKLIAYGGFCRPQLFDMAADPAEVHDLAAEPTAEARAVLHDLSAVLYRNWEPDAANRTAKLATEHARRLHPFHRDIDGLMPEVWWPPEGWAERREPWPQVSCAGEAT